MNELKYRIMQAAFELVEDTQIFKLPNGGIAIEFFAPISFVFRTNRKFSDKQLCQIDDINEELRIENNAFGDFEISPRSFPETSRQNMEIIGQIGEWAKQDKTGVCFESSAKFTLPNGAKRMPDATWILKDRWFALSETERTRKFTRIAPDFVIELRSVSDRLPILQKKMREYIENGVRLGWLIDPLKKRVHIYRADKTVEILENPENVSGENILQGFELDLTEIW